MVSKARYLSLALCLCALLGPGREAQANDDDFIASPRADADAWVAVEVGYGMSADDSNLFEQGLGRSLVFSLAHWELRLYETYDLDDQSGLYDSETSEGRMAITSIARRLGIIRLGPLGLSGLLGATWVSRPSIRYDPESIIGDSDFASMGQHGFGAVLGLGASVALGRRAFLAFDLRAHPVAWLDIAGQRVEWDGEQATTISIDEQPGGIPTTGNISLGLRF